MKILTNKFVLIIAILVVVLAAGFLFSKQDKDDVPSYKEEQVTRGDVLVVIGASGTVEPEDVIDIGAQISGQITSFGTDVNGAVIDYGSIVKANSLLATIDNTVYVYRISQANAALNSAQAGLKYAKAVLEQANAKLYQSQRDWERAQRLGLEALSQVDYDSYQSNYEVAKADVTVAQASITQAEAKIEQEKSSLAEAQRNLDYCTINSPVDGIIIDRRVNIGQTVSSNLNAPSLFLLAKDLKQIQVWVAVNEADIGRIYPGQPVTFTVDTFPDDKFVGTVSRIRLNASMTQNVVTYTVEITTDNSTGKLLPYLTANVEFEVSCSKNVLMVPNEALRWTPSELQNPADSTAPAVEDAKAGKEVKDADNRVVWVFDGQNVTAVKVVTGLNNGFYTEIKSGDIKEGAKVVIGTDSDDAAASTTNTNPFLPKMPMRGGGRQMMR